MSRHIRYAQISDDGKLLFPQMDLETKQFLHNNKGKQVIMTLEIFSTGASPNMDGYWRKVVLPTLQEAFRNAGEPMNAQQTEIKMCDIIGVDKRFVEMHKTEKAAFITRCRQIAETELYTIIPDAK